MSKSRCVRIMKLVVHGSPLSFDLCRGSAFSPSMATVMSHSQAYEGIGQPRSLLSKLFLWCFRQQVLAIVLRPKKDHKVRPYWNVYHHVVGYTTIIIIIVNIFDGINILQPENKWRNAYAAVLISLGAISLLLEIITWTIYFRRAKDAKPVSHNQFDRSSQAQQVV